MRTGLYPGTFDPLTRGHIDIIERATHIVDTLVIGVAANEAKGPLFSLDERCAIVDRQVEKLRLRENTKVEVRPFSGLLMHFAEHCGAQCIIRGLRAVQDFEYEFQMTAMNGKLNPNIDTVFLMAEVSQQATASSLVKEIARLGGDVSHFVTKDVETLLLEKFKQ